MEKKKSRNGFEKSSVDQTKQQFYKAALLPVLGNKPALVYGGWKAQKGPRDVSSSLFGSVSWK
jgi:hypothetical protein